MPLNPLAPPVKYMTLIGMTAQYRGEIQWTGIIHEVQGSYALVQYVDGTWQLVSMDKISSCSLVPPVETASEPSTP